MASEDVSSNQNVQPLKAKKVLIAVNVLLLFGVSFLIGSQFASAQVKNAKKVPYTAQFPELKEQLSTTVTPENPGPGENITISIESYSFDINNAQFTWKIDGKVVNNSLGSKSITFKNGPISKTTTIELAIDPKDRPVITRTFNFTPGETDILWQANTYTHPFYKGKSLFTPEATVTFVAMPQNANGFIEPTKTIFNWRINESNDAARSGIARNTYTFEGPIIIRPITIAVETYSPTPGAGDQKQVSTKEISLETYLPSLRVYADSPSLGVLFNRAISGTQKLNSPEVRIAAYPYFQSIAGKNSDTEYTWLVDDNKVEIPATQNSLILRKKEVNSGTSFISVQSRTPMKILQTVETSFALTFDKNSFGQNETSESEFGN